MDAHRSCEDGIIYVDGEPVGGVKALRIDLDTLTDQKKRRPLHGIHKDVKVEIHFENLEFDRLGILSLIYGMRITNNWLKVHGGVMCRNSSKKRCRKNKIWRGEL